MKRKQVAVPGRQIGPYITLPPSHFPRSRNSHRYIKYITATGYSTSRKSRKQACGRHRHRTHPCPRCHRQQRQRLRGRRHVPAAATPPHRSRSGADLPLAVRQHGNTQSQRFWAAAVDDTDGFRHNLSKRGNRLQSGQSTRTEALSRRWEGVTITITPNAGMTIYRSLPVRIGFAGVASVSFDLEADTCDGEEKE